MAFGGADLYPTIVEKAGALGFSLIMNHPFVDGNKRVGHSAMETFLVINGYEIVASAEEQERISSTWPRASCVEKRSPNGYVLIWPGRNHVNPRRGGAAVAVWCDGA